MCVCVCVCVRGGGGGGGKVSGLSLMGEVLVGVVEVLRRDGGVEHVV